MSEEIRPFEIAVSDAALDDLRDRLRHARFPDELPDAGWDYGTDVDWLRSAATYWADEYDWRAVEARLNRLDHFTTTIDGQNIHFVHQRSPHETALPLVLTHGWPGSISEFDAVVEPLIDPPDPADAFHVVVPSLPGYGWSGPTTEAGWDVRRTATAWATLMARLGYDDYGAQGGDWGSMVTQHLAHVDPDHVRAIHLNMLISMPPGEDDDLADLSELEAAQLARSQDYLASGSGYVAIQSTRPQSLAYGLNDSPVGLLSWIAEKFYAWTDNDGRIEDAVSLDDLLTDVTIYWVTETAGSSARMYHETIGRGSAVADPLTHLPVGVANFPAEIVSGRRRWAEARHNIVRWTDMPRGGHFAALEEPDLFVDDVRAFFGQVR